MIFILNLASCTRKKVNSTKASLKARSNFKQNSDNNTAVEPDKMVDTTLEKPLKSETNRRQEKNIEKKVNTKAEQKEEKKKAGKKEDTKKKVKEEAARKKAKEEAAKKKAEEEEARKKAAEEEEAKKKAEEEAAKKKAEEEEARKKAKEEAAKKKAQEDLRADEIIELFKKNLYFTKINSKIVEKLESVLITFTQSESLEEKAKIFNGVIRTFNSTNKIFNAPSINKLKSNVIEPMIDHIKDNFDQIALMLLDKEAINNAKKSSTLFSTNFDLFNKITIEN